MTTSLVIITEIIAPYRVPVFNALAARPEVALHVIFLSENDPALRKWRIYKEEIKFSYQVLSSWRGRFGNRGMLLNRGLHSALDHIKPQVLVCGGYNFPAYWQATRWAKRRHTPFILWSESTTFDRRRRHRSTEFMKSRFLTSCSGFIVPGKSSSDYLQELGVAEFSIFIAPNAVDTSLFSRLGLAAKKHENQIRAAHDLPSRYFLYVGRLVKEKGIFDLLEAYCQLKPEIRKDVGLVFVGTGSQREELEKRASKVVVGSIQFLNFVQRDDLAAMYALAEVLIFPTHSDPWGLVVNEAMACGLPVITTNVAGCAADLVEHGWNGFVVERGNVADLASEMVRCAVDSTLRDTLGRRSRARIDEYSPAAWAQGVIEAARFVCGK
jgi:glycosyltransferase involved in cell wall biosynthesis